MLSGKRKNQKGQAVLIVLLSLSVVLIIVLYIMSRSITDISLSSKEGDSMRAFSAAEAGIERALVIGTGGSGNFDDANFTASVTEFGQGKNKITYPISLKSGEIATFWFKRVGDAISFNSSPVKVCWGDKDTPNSGGLTPAIEITAYYLEGGVYKLARTALDPDGGRTATNYFGVSSGGSCTIDNEEFEFSSSVTLPVTGELQFMTAKILYNTTISHKIGIDVSSTGAFLPSQGVVVNSDGSFANANRSIEVFQLHPVAPSIFMNSVFSSTGITK